MRNLDTNPTAYQTTSGNQETRSLRIEIQNFAFKLGNDEYQQLDPSSTRPEDRIGEFCGRPTTVCFRKFGKEIWKENLNPAPGFDWRRILKFDWF